MFYRCLMINIINYEFKKIMNMATKIGKYFTLEELTRSDKAKELKIENRATDLAELKLKSLCIYLLDPLREKFGRIKINSGYRNPIINKAVGGVHNSNHTKGTAADCVFLDANIRDVWEYLKANPDNLKWSEAGLYEYKGFIHLAYDKCDLSNEMFIGK